MAAEQPKLHKLVFLENNRSTFNFIKEGKKKIETRAGNPEYLKIMAGDTIEFICGNESFKAMVTNVHRFSDLDGLFAAYLPSQINPEVSGYEELRERYMAFHGYLERIKEFGILAFELQ